MKVLVIGAGRVGLANAQYLSDNHDVSVLDISQDIITTLKLGKNPYPGSEISVEKMNDNHVEYCSTYPLDIDEDLVIIVTTPGDMILEVLEQISKNVDESQIKMVIIRSTLPLGIAHLLENGDHPFRNSIIGFPEFLVEGQEDIGVVSEVGQNFSAIIGDDSTLFTELNNLYDMVCLRLDKFSDPFIVKVWVNAMLAAKVTIANTIQDYFGLGKDLSKILRAIELDPRLGKNYFKPGIGYGGSCLPFAVSELNAFQLFETIQHLNNSRPEKLLDLLKGNVVLVSGYNFKKGVADCRNSNQLKFIQAIHDSGRVVYVIDDYYNGLISDYWVYNPFNIWDEITDLVIFYETKKLLQLKIHYQDWSMKNVIDFR